MAPAAHAATQVQWRTTHSMCACACANGSVKICVQAIQPLSNSNTRSRWSYSDRHASTRILFPLMANTCIGGDHRTDSRSDSCSDAFTKSGADRIADFISDVHSINISKYEHTVDIANFISRDIAIFVPVSRTYCVSKHSLTHIFSDIFMRHYRTSKCYRPTALHIQP